MSVDRKTKVSIFYDKMCMRIGTQRSIKVIQKLQICHSQEYIDKYMTSKRPYVKWELQNCPECKLLTHYSIVIVAPPVA